MYTTQAKVEAYLDRDLDDNEAVIIDDIIAHISQIISTYCNREWLSVIEDDEDEADDVEASARYFDGNGSHQLVVDDFVQATEIKMYDSTNSLYLTLTNDSGNDWIVTPANKTPYDTITLRAYSFLRGIANIKITAVWGAGRVPQPITTVATALTGKFLQKMSTSGGKFKSENIEGYSYQLMDSRDVDADVRNLMTTLDMYKKFQL